MDWQGKRLSERQKIKLLKETTEASIPRLVTMSVNIKGIVFTSSLIQGSLVVDRFLSKKKNEKQELAKSFSGDKLEFTITGVTALATITVKRKHVDEEEGEEAPPPDKQAPGYKFYVHHLMPLNPHTRKRWINEAEYKEFIRDYPEELPKL